MLGFHVCDLIDTPLMPAAFESRVQPQRNDFIGEAERDDASAHGEHVGIVVLAGQTSRVEIVAQGRSHTRDFVGGDLLALSAAAEDDPSIGPALDHRSPNVRADGGIVNRFFGVRAEIVDVVTKPSNRVAQMLLQREPRMVGADRYAHTINYIGTSMIPSVSVTSRGADRVLNGHPWVYRSDLVEVSARGGDTVLVAGPRGRPVGYALYSDRSEIALRLLTRGTEAPNLDTWRARLDAAITYRESLEIDATAYRLAHGEADQLPGLVVDRYGEYLVLQTLTQGVDRLLPDLTQLLVDRLHPGGILARNDPRVRLLEGLAQQVEVLHGTVPEVIEIREGSITYAVDPYRGQKTGLFLDQRENRVAARQYARGRLLDAFSYHGGFALALATLCTEVVAIDISEDAVARIKANAARNGLAHVEARAMNVFDELRELERRREPFDTIVLDPPAFAKNKAAVPKALSGYKEINLRALKLLRPGGVLITCSCSYNVSEATFADLLASAAVDAHADVVVVEKRMQSRDHPVLITVPETYYLKCFVLRKLG
jgi:23S rRNA (cytosine1962-C5)-methyltransferase